MQVFGFKANKCKEEVVAKVDLINLIYPVGSIYMSANNVNPTTLFGGTWQKLEGRFLLGASSSYPLGNTGGEASHKLTISELPSHSHKYDSYAGAISVDNGDGTDLGMLLRTPQENVDTGNSGGNVAHNNMPPYLSVNIWKRTA